MTVQPTPPEIPAPQPSPSPAAEAAPVAGTEAPPAFTPRTPRRQEGPRRIKNGVRLRRREGIDGLPWPADPWLGLVTGRMTLELRAEALDYAKAGQTASLVVAPGLVEAVVQGRAPRPYRVRVEVGTLSPAEWDRLVATMAAEAIWSAKLLSGELPQSIELLFQGLGRSLVPASHEEFAATCTCEGEAPCKHLGCVWMLLSERLAADPLLAFTLRGLDGQRMLERLQEARSIATRGTAKAHSTPPVAEGAAAPPPVERLLADFWKPGRQLDEAEQSAPDEHVPHALLKRLGPTPFQASANRAKHIQAAPAKGMPAAPPAQPTGPTSRFPLVGLLASVYDSIAAAGRRLREDPTPEQSPTTSETAGETAGETNADR